MWGGNGSPLLADELYVDRCGKQESTGGKGASEVLCTERMSKGELKNDGAVVLSLNGLLLELLASFVLAASDSGTVKTELAYFFCYS